MSAVPASQPKKLSLFTKLAFGAGDLGPAIVSIIRGFFLNAFLIEVAGLRPVTAGIIFLIARIWDAVNDPIIGTLSDRTNTRWGRRRPWFLFGSVPFAIAFVMQWLVPDLSPNGLFIYYVVVAILLDSGFTAVNVPYAAMTPELAPDYDQRTSLNSYRFSFSILGSTIALVIHSVIVGGGEDLRQSYFVSAIIWAAIIVISNVIVFLATKERYFQETDPSEQYGFFEGLKVAFSNKPFIYVTSLYLLSWLAIQFTQNNLLLYVKYWVGAEDQFQFMVLALQFTSFIFLLVWTAVSQRIGKKAVYYIGCTIWISISVVLFFVPAGIAWPIYIIAPIAAMGVAVCFLVPWSLLPDVVDLDELETGQRREGIFYGFFVFLQKLGLSIGIVFSNLALENAGYITPEYEGATLAATQPDSVLLALRIFVSIVPAVILLVSFLVIRLYPISRQRLEEIQNELELRRAA